MSGWKEWIVEEGEEWMWWSDGKVDECKGGVGKRRVEVKVVVVVH